MHERQAIRQAVVAQLRGSAPDYNTAAGARVFETRMAPIRSAELPAISVYTSDETIDADSAATAPRELRRTLQLAIEAWCAATVNVDDAFDALALQIETAMDSDVNLADTCFSCVLSSIETGIKMEADKPMGCVRLEYSVVYHTDLRTSAADTAREIFDTAAVQYSLEGNQATLDQAADLVDNIHE